MNIELKNIRHYERLSEETNCYTATLYLNGKAIADVGNRGNGGPDHVHHKFGCSHLLEQVEAYFRSLPPSVLKDGPETAEHLSIWSVPYDLEIWCCEQVTEFLVVKDFKKAIKANILVQKDGNIVAYSYKGVKTLTAAHFESFAKRHPDLPMLNLMQEAQALAIYKSI